MLIRNLLAGDLRALLKGDLDNCSLDRVTEHQLEGMWTMPGCKIVSLVIALCQRYSGLRKLNVILLSKDT